MDACETVVDRKFDVNCPINCSITTNAMKYIVCKYDILFLCESWLKDNNLIEIDGFAKVSCVNRKQNIGIRSEGGIAVFCKNHIVDGIFVEKKFEYGIVIIKLDKLFFNSFDDTFICFAYIPHEKSNFYQICEHDFHDIIESIVLEYKSKGSVIVCGDLNSRTGELYDILETDNLDRLIYGVESDDIPSISKRRSMDKVTNVFGRKLLQMCYNTGLTIANGRLGDDGDGKFTFCSSKEACQTNQWLKCIKWSKIKIQFWEFQSIKSSKRLNILQKYKDVTEKYISDKDSSCRRKISKWWKNDDMQRGQKETKITNEFIK
ncbi:E3.1.11.2 [Mytilus coruscus]|uniref:E3.1.11.2 n=1 Tax=Mytilus coruscus TaxID=42192 RepID=A0A6J8CTV8_MYTCO|nr:E3.1.11.2 [Mytilus coruscus]